jgi:hypothetical protein
MATKNQIVPTQNSCLGSSGVMLALRDYQLYSYVTKRVRIHKTEFNNYVRIGNYPDEKKLVKPAIKTILPVTG